MPEFAEFLVTCMRLYLADYHLIIEGCILLKSGLLHPVVNLLLS